MNELFKGSSIAERGTMCQLRNDFDHRNVKTNVMQSFNHTNDFYQFLCEALSTNLAMQELNINSVNECPKTSPYLKGNEVKKKYFDDLCSKIVETVWQGTDDSEISKVVTADATGEYSWCICHEGIKFT